MYKRGLISSFIFMITIILTSTFLYAEKIIVLKDGAEIRGEVISGNDSSITVKSENKIHTFKRIDIKSIKKRQPRGGLLLPPEELYKKMTLRIDQDDAEAQYRLGLFCLERNLFDYAAVEFDKAKKLDNRCAAIIDVQLQKIYKAKVKGAYDIGLYYYNNGKYKIALNIFKEALKAYPDSSMLEELQEMIELSKERLIFAPVMTEKEIKEKLKKREFLVPYTAETVKAINSYLADLIKSEDDDSKSRLKEYCTRYLVMANSYLETAESDMGAERWRDFQIALYCYEIAAYDRDLSGDVETFRREIRKKINENFQSKLSAPLTLSKLKWAEAFIEGIETRGEERRLSASWYYEVAKEYESRVKNRQTALNKALYCYLVLANSFPEQSEVEKVGLYGWARCFEKLEK